MEGEQIENMGIAELLEMLEFAGRKVARAALAVLAVQRRAEAIESGRLPVFRRLSVRAHPGHSFQKPFSSSARRASARE